MKFIAKTFEGLENVLATELEELGAKSIEILTRAVAFEGDLRLMYRANYLLRTALRILEIKKEFEVTDTDDLYRKIYKFPWDQMIRIQDTFAVDAVTSGEIFTHSKFTALKVKDAIVDKIRRVKGDRPNVNIMTPTHRINIHVRNTTATLSLDTSGESLHLRGYRISAVDAPLNEVMAAGLVLLSGWDKKTPLIDPMCGSATILIEANKIARNIPPQDPKRGFIFKKWEKFDKELWQDIVDETLSTETEGPKIIGIDKNLRAVKISQQNIEEAGATNQISITKQDFFKSEKHSGATIITNPPYDVRLREDDIFKFYKKMGDQLKENYTNSTVWIFSGALEALKNVGLKSTQKYNLMNGGIETKFYKFEMYEGTNK